MFVTATLLSLFIYFLLTWKSSGKSKGASSSLPGPWGFPLLGHLPFMMVKSLNKAFADWSQKFGPIYAIRLGPFPAIVLTDSRIIRKAFSMEAFSGRPYIKMFEDSDGKRKGIIMNHGKSLIEQRQFVLKTLMRFSADSNKYETNIQEEVAQLVKTFSAKSNHKMSIQHKFSAPVLNTLWENLMGEKFRHDDQNLHNMVHIMSRVTTNYGHLQILAMALSWIGDWFPNSSNVRPTCHSFQLANKTFKECIARRNESRTKGQPRDFTDVYLDKIEDTTDPRSSFNATRNQQERTTTDLFTAGVETTGGAMEWIILLMARHPQIQKLVQQEIDLIVGHSRPPQLSDRPQLPVIESVICETLRFVSFTPIGIPHMTIQDVTFEGYHIPKYTTVFSSYHSLHQNDKLWGDPEVFRPSRFLEPDEKGRVLWRKEHFLPFSTKKRACVGEKLAKDSLLLLTAGIFQRFSVSFPDGSESHVDKKLFESLQQSNSLVALPVAQDVVFTDRFHPHS